MGLLVVPIFWLAVASSLSANLLGYDDLTVLIICQGSSVSEDKCNQLEKSIYQKTEESTSVIRTPRDISSEGDWTIIPVLRILEKTLGHVPPWLIFCTEDTSIQIDALLPVLSIHNHSEPVFLGRALTDREPTIIHHFSPQTDFLYPLIASGFAISRQLFETLRPALRNNSLVNDIDFSIDASYELSLFLLEAAGCALTNSVRFCIYPSNGCATFVSIREIQDKLIDLDSLFFAVKTCKKFHKDRVPAVVETWGNKVTNIAFYSDYHDENIPTVVLTNVTNTPYGHCSKTRNIIRTLRAKFKEQPSLLWAVISDDDTILSVRRIQELVSGYDASQPVAIGERYGYHVYKESGYNYLTGGGGVILSRAALLKFHGKACQCPAPSTPDDMFLFGICIKRLGIISVHTPLIHQARPDDYNKDYLSIGRPVSFHKHWMVEPRTIYKTWFLQYDSLIYKSIEHTEF